MCEVPGGSILIFLLEQFLVASVKMKKGSDHALIIINGIDK